MATLTLYPTTHAAVSGTGWNTGTSNAYSASDSNAVANTATVAKNSTESGDFGGFSLAGLPANYVVNSVTIQVRWRHTGNSTGATLGAWCVSGGSTVDTELTRALVTTLTEDSAAKTITRVQLENAFKVRVRASRTTSNTATTGELEYIRIVVDYTATTEKTATSTANAFVAAVDESHAATVNALVAAVDESHAATVNALVADPASGGTVTEVASWDGVSRTATGTLNDCVATGVAPSGACLLVALVTGNCGSAGLGTSYPTVSGGGLEWTRRGGSQINTPPSTMYAAAFVFTATATGSEGTFDVAATWAGGLTTANVRGISVVEFSGADESHLGTPVAITTGRSITVTPAASNSIVVAAFATGSQTAAPTAATGTTLYDGQGTGGAVAQVRATDATTQGVDVAVGLGGTNNFYGVALEVQPNGGATTKTGDATATALVQATIESNTATATVVVSDGEPSTALSIDVAFPKIGTRDAYTGTTVVSPAFTPGGDSRLLVALLVMDASGLAANATISDTGTHTWTNHGYVTGYRGGIWTTWVDTATELTVTATLSQNFTGHGTLSVWSIANANQTTPVGDTDIYYASSSRVMNVIVTATAAGNLMLGAGKDGVSAITVTPAANTTIDHQRTVGSTTQFAYHLTDLTTGAGDVTFGTTNTVSASMVGIGVEILAGSAATTKTYDATASALVQATVEPMATSSALAAETTPKTSAATALVQATVEPTATSSALAAETTPKTSSVTALVQATIEPTATSSAFVAEVAVVTKTAVVNALVQATVPVTGTVCVLIAATDATHAATVNALVAELTNVTKTAVANALVQATVPVTGTARVLVAATDATHAATVAGLVQATISPTAASSVLVAATKATSTSTVAALVAEAFERTQVAVATVLVQATNSQPATASTFVAAVVPKTGTSAVRIAATIENHTATVGGLIAATNESRFVTSTTVIQGTTTKSASASAIVAALVEKTSTASVVSSDEVPLAISLDPATASGSEAGGTIVRITATGSAAQSIVSFWFGSAQTLTFTHLGSGIYDVTSPPGTGTTLVAAVAGAETALAATAFYYAPPTTYTIFVQLPDGTVDAIPCYKGTDGYHVVLERPPRLPLTLNPAGSVSAVCWVVSNDFVPHSAFLMTEKEPGQERLTTVVRGVNYSDSYYLHDADQPSEDQSPFGDIVIVPFWGTPDGYPDEATAAAVLAALADFVNVTLPAEDFDAPAFVYDPAVAVSVTPAVATIPIETTQQFAATVLNATDASVNWTCTAGSISSSGLFTAPSTSQTITVTATSVEDDTKSGSATVTVVHPAQALIDAYGSEATADAVLTALGTFVNTYLSAEDYVSPALVRVTISPATVTLNVDTQQQFVSTVVGTANNSSVTWQATAGIISTSGLFTAPSTGQVVTVTATSVEVPSRSGTGTATVVHQAQAIIDAYGSEATADAVLASIGTFVNTYLAAEDYTH